MGLIPFLLSVIASTAIEIPLHSLQEAADLPHLQALENSGSLIENVDNVCLGRKRSSALYSLELHLKNSTLPSARILPGLGFITFLVKTAMKHAISTLLCPAHTKTPTTVLKITEETQFWDSIVLV